MAGAFNDSDAFNAAVQVWNLDFRQLDAGAFHAELSQLGTPDVVATSSRFNRKLKQGGTAPSGYMTFGIPGEEHTRFRRMGCDLNGSNVVIFKSGDALDCVSEAGFGAHTMSVSLRRLQQLVHTHELNSLSDLLSKQEHFLQSNLQVRSRLRQAIASYSACGKQRPDVLSNRVFLKEYESNLLECLLAGVVQAKPFKARPMAHSRAHALKRALAVIHDRHDKSLTATELPALAGVSARTLLYAFQQEFGLSPKEYMKLYRLHQLRRALKQGRPVLDTVAGVANEHGFWHMGQLAQDYRKLFDELPSETLKR